MARYELASHELASCAGAAGKADALFELGLRYCAGRDVALDLVEAHKKWFNIAALRGSSEAMRYRAELAREMSKAEVARAQRLAREWLALH
jgi:TPR repeat protein